MVVNAHTRGGAKWPTIGALGSFGFTDMEDTVQWLSEINKNQTSAQGDVGRLFPPDKHNWFLLTFDMIISNKMGG